MDLFLFVKMVKILLHEIPALSGDYRKEMPLAPIFSTTEYKKVNNLTTQQCK